jgi:pyruvate formate lyase activating enzyme
MGKEKISKREFLKQCALGAGGVALGLNAIDIRSFSNSKGIVPVDIWKWHKLATYYTKTEIGVQCKLCPNEHYILPGEKSPCRSRVNYKGDLYSVGYGNPCTVNVDPIEKKPLLHFLPQTKAFSLAVAGCTFSCLNCQNWQISQVSPFETDNYDLMPGETVAAAIKNACPSIAFTYSEPTTFYEYAYDTSKLAHEKGLKNLWISNGYINEKPLRDLCAYIDAANINLKSFKDEIYMKLNGGKLNTILNTLKTFKEEGVWLEITNLVIPQWTDDLDMIREMCAWLVKNGFQDQPLHFSRFFPLYKLTSLPSTPESVLNQARQIAMDAGMKYVYIGNVPGSEAQHTYCPSCKKIVIERRGYTIITKNLKDGACGSCGTKINGVWQ